MKVALSERFREDAMALPAPTRARLLDVILAIPVALREPHRHSGLGLRKLHPSGIWEARVGLDLRLVFALARDEVILIRAGSHDEVRRWLRAL